MNILITNYKVESFDYTNGHLMCSVGLFTEDGSRVCSKRFSTNPNLGIELLPSEPLNNITRLMFGILDEMIKEQFDTLPLSE